MVAVGAVAGILLTVVYTDRDDRTHYLSAQAAPEGARSMGLVRKSMEEIRAMKPKINRKILDATTEEDVRRHMIEDGEDPDAELTLDMLIAPANLRRRLGMTQEEFAGALGIPVATLRNWEQGRNGIDPAARSLLILVARDPEGALAALAAARSAA